MDKKFTCTLSHIMKNEGIATAAWVLCQSDFDFVLYVTLAPKNQNWDSLLQLTSLSKSRGSDSCHREIKNTFLRRISQSNVVSRHETIRKRLDS